MNQINLHHPLFDAVLHGQTNRVLSLLREGADINTRYPEQFDRPWIGTHKEFHWGNLGNWIPLHLAAHVGQKDVALLLLEYGADIEAKTPDRITPLMIAVQYDRVSVVDLLVRMQPQANAFDAIQSALFAAVRRGHADVVRLLIDFGADIHQRDESGDTALADAVECKHEDTIRLLLERGAEVNTVNKNGISPLGRILRLSYRENWEAILQLLLEYGARPASFQEAVMLGDVAAGETWIANGVDINAPIGNYTPLRLAIRHKRAEFLRMLI